ncbi:PH domain-containing protein, partial [Thermoanaerobaculum aquaticum]|uniref:PH domain-containing protein n=1 Tax=Thermoanaerobaculum aquaticum TaxID=1312852 RepID=UPI001F2F15D6
MHTKEGLWGDTTSFPLKGLRESKVVRVSGGTRLSGKQSAGYCAGWFTYPELGKVWQVTDCGEDVVLLAFSSGVRVLLAPQDPEAFLAAVSHRQQASFALRVNPQAKRGIAWDLVVLVLLLPIAIAVWVLALIHKGPARLAYAFEPGFLLVRTFALLKRFDLQGATAQVVEPRGLARL